MVELSCCLAGRKESVDADGDGKETEGKRWRCWWSPKIARRRGEEVKQMVMLVIEARREGENVVKMGCVGAGEKKRKKNKAGERIGIA